MNAGGTEHEAAPTVVDAASHAALRVGKPPTIRTVQS